MAKVNIEFEGADQLIRKFNNQPAAIQREASGIIMNSALQVEKRASDNAPVDTGYLRQHITANKTGEMSAEVVASADYAIYQEYGTRKMSAHPFMRPAMDQEGPLFMRKLQNLLNGGLR